MQLSVSILNSEDKSKTIQILNNTDISYIHIDVMDGIFVSQKSLQPIEITKLSNISTKPLDIHLMVSDPIKYINEIKTLPNIDNITIHLEINKDINKILNTIKEYNIKRSIAINPTTNINKIIPYLDNIDRILLMTVNPGKGGQPFIEESITRLEELTKLITNKPIEIEVDGGINNQTITKVKKANIFVVGSYITKSPDIIAQINKIYESYQKNNDI